MTHLFRWALSLLPLALVGCAQLPPAGTLDLQRSRYSLHDPYPDDRAGPEVVGGRPLGYERPKTEGQRSQWFRENVFW